MVKNMICIVCPLGCKLEITGFGGELSISGNKCEKGLSYADEELTNPVRMVCTTVRIVGGLHSVLPVRTDKALPDRHKLDVVKAVNSIVLKSPVKMGDVIVSDFLGTGVNVVAERDM